jgi:acetyl esterase/lipase
LTVETESYGPADGQEGDLYLPGRAHPPVVCLLHGGFWRMPHGRDQLHAIAEDLARRGYAVWNLGYRRLGAPGGGWPGTFEDVAAGVDHLAHLAARGIDLDLTRVAVAGHSAGGQLALWVAARGDAVVPVAMAIGLAPVADLARAHELGLGKGAVTELLAGGPAEVPARYAAASPRQRLPLRVPQVLIHGSDDPAVPVAMSRDYARAAAAAGDDVALLELPGLGHMEFLDPTSDAHEALVARCARLAGRDGETQR